MESSVAGDSFVLTGASCELKRTPYIGQLAFRHGELGEHFRPIGICKELITTTRYCGIDKCHYLIAGLVEEGLAITVVNSSVILGDIDHVVRLILQLNYFFVSGHKHCQPVPMTRVISCRWQGVCRGQHKRQGRPERKISRTHRRLLPCYHLRVIGADALARSRARGVTRLQTERLRSAKSYVPAD